MCTPAISFNRPARVPSTMDVLGTFEVTLSEDGEVLGFRRLGRHRPSATDDGRA